ncbi:MAG: hypothetical protein EBZ69_06450 [Alphaproteobacteria bacterium]|nr:hypothetical protein [Alphaproteobacteria bacterium]
MRFGTSNSYASGITNTAMTIDTSGNVGIGTSTPGSRLEVQATVGNAIYGRTTAANYSINGTAGNSAWGGVIGFTENTLNFGILGYQNAYGVYGYGSTYGGYFIGSVNHGVYAQGANASMIGTYSYNAGSGCYEYAGYAAYGSYTNCNAYVAGTLYYGGLAAISDGRLKENVKDIHSSLDTLMALRPVSYTWKKDAGQAAASPGKNFGFIAQEVQKVLPEIVRESKRPPTVDEPVIPETAAGMGANNTANPRKRLTKKQTLNDKMESTFSVDYSEIIPITVGAIQELKKENEALRDELKAMRTKIDTLEAARAHHP